jgi:hypothetical protein
MPVLGRSKISGTRSGRRLGSRFFTRVYVETHVRDRLETIRRCLQLERMAMPSAGQEDAIKRLEEQLGDALEPLLGWRRLLGLVARLPPVAAVVPILTALVSLPLGGTVTRHDAVTALVALGATALVLWVLIVWPSVRLGFRVKRAILCGGCDVARPIANIPGEVCWEGFPVGKVYEDRRLWRDLRKSIAGTNRYAPPPPFPKHNVYQAEVRVFDALGRRKPVEPPLDILLGFTLYILFILGALDVLALIRIFSHPGRLSFEQWLAVPVLVIFVSLPFQSTLSARYNHHRRPH